MIDWFWTRITTSKGNELGTICKVRSKPIVDNASDTLVVKFGQKNFMVNSVKGLLKIHKNTTCKLALINGLSG